MAILNFRQELGYRVKFSSLYEKSKFLGYQFIYAATDESLFRYIKTRIT
jgi:hypothetical protein